jgi:hypothetical protein
MKRINPQLSQLNMALVVLALFAAAPASAMQCEKLFEGAPPPELPTQWACLGNPAIKTPVSFWKQFGMGITFPNQASHAPHAFVVCKYTLYLGQRHVTWQTYFYENSTWYPYPLDGCVFYCIGTPI